MVGDILITDNPAFDHICAYVAGETKKAEVLATHGVRDTSWADMAEDFNVQKADNPKLTRAVMHVALAWSPQDQAISNELMVELTRAWMIGMKIDPDNTQWSLTRHNNTKHPHGHLVINRVGNDGRTIPDNKDYEKSVTVCRKLEEKYGLVKAKEAGLDTRRAKREELPERDAAKLHVQDSESRHKPLAAYEHELLSAMKQDGIKSEATYGPDGKLRTVVYEYQGHYFKGSELGRECSGNNVAKTIDAQRESVLAERAALNAAVEQAGQSGTGLEAFFAAIGAQANAAEKAERDASARQQVNEKTQHEVKEQLQEPAEKAVKQTTPPVEKIEKPENPDLDCRLRPGYKKPPTIEEDFSIDI